MSKRSAKGLPSALCVPKLRRRQTTVYTYDAANQQTGALRADGASEGRAYAADGHVITSADGLSHATLATYNPLGRLLSRATRSGYDYGGNRTPLSDVLGRVTTSAYDALNRLSSLTYSDGATPNVAYTYSPTSQRATMTDGTGTTGYTYDALDRVITTTSGAGTRVGYGYNAADDLTRLVYPDGSVVTRTFDALDRPITLTDWLRKSTSFAYDANSNLLTQTYPNTTTASYGYDALNPVTSIVDKAGGVPFWTYSYTRDALGRLTSAVDPLQALTHTYGYDRLNRLTSDSAGSVISTTWTYNAAHDLIQSVDALRHITGTLTYDPADGLTHLRVVSGTLVQHDDTLTQNGVGARTVLSDSVSGTVLGYGYDQAERLITATTGVTASSYAYDGDGLRQTKTVSGAAYTATWDLAGGLPTLLQENATRYVIGPGGLPLELVAGSTAYSYYQDQLGSTRGLLGATGRGVASASYSPYGVTGGYDGVYQPLGYAGQYTDAESGLQYLRARYYDPATAQFLTRDPLESLTGQPYAYANDSPLNYTDPLGLQCNGPQGASFSVGRLFSSIGDTGCNLGEAKDATLQTAVTTVTPSCASVPGGCRPPTTQEVVAQLGSVKDAALSAGTTTAQDVGTALRPNCTPLLQDCRLATAAEQLQTTYSIYAGLYGGLNALTFGAEGQLGQYAGLTSLECNAQYQQGARLAQAGSLALGAYGATRTALGLARGLRPVVNTAGMTPMQIGNLFHYDRLNGAQGAFGPSQLQARYPQTTFRFVRRGQNGADVEVTGGIHPSAYRGSTWPPGSMFADFKPDPNAVAKVAQEIRSGKLPGGTVALPYDPATLTLLP